MKTAVFTIGSKNYLSFIRTLFSSIEKYHPDWDKYTLLVDEIEGKFIPEKENFSTIGLSDINLPNYKKMAFRYSILEFNTAVKPWMFSWLFNNKQYDKVIYLDPDIYLYEKLNEVEELLDESLMVLTPHLTDIIDDDKRPSEHYISNYGVFNLGFLGMSKHNETNKFLDWWKDKLEYNCLFDLENNLFVDQRWMDFAPCLFSDVNIIRHPGYNVAWWNLSHRNVNKKDDKFYVNEKPLKFFHYSGIQPMNCNQFSKNQNIYTYEDLKYEKELVKNYIQEVISNGYYTTHNWMYYYDRFSDGMPISEFIKAAYKKYDLLQTLCAEDPFQKSYVFLSTPIKYDEINNELPIITHIMYEIWISRDDLQKAFPDIFGANRTAFCHWFISSAQREYNFPKQYILPILNSFKKKDFNKLEDGVNLIGYSRAEMGIGESCRLGAKALETANIPFGVINFSTENPARNNDFSLCYKETKNPNHNINLFYINADAMNIAYSTFGINLWKDRYNIASWHWELPDFPDEFRESFKYVNEIWGSSQFIVNSISKKSPVPVIYMPHPISLNCSKQLTRKDFHLPEERFLFLSMYDVNSYKERKNPIGSIEAFKMAFKSNDENVGLIIKVNNLKYDIKQIFELKELTKGYKNIYFIDCILTREEINSLLNLVDCFVSLHRSEGFGLPLAESMYLGKPAIGTNWSGNTDFMNENNSCIVDYKLVNLSKDYGPYKSYQYWADPNIEHASEYMKKLVNDKEYYEKIALAGKQTIIENYNPQKVGLMMINRFKDMALL